MAPLDQETVHFNFPDQSQAWKFLSKQRSVGKEPWKGRKIIVDREAETTSLPEENKPFELALETKGNHLRVSRWQSAVGFSLSCPEPIQPSDQRFFDHLKETSFIQPVCIKIPAQTKYTLRLHHHLKPHLDRELVAFRFCVEIGDGAELNILEDWEGDPQSAYDFLFFKEMHLHVGKSARLRRYSSFNHRDNIPQKIMLDDQIQAQEDAQVFAAYESGPSNLWMHCLKASLQGPGAETQFYFLTAPQEKNIVETRVNILHASPSAKSKQVYRSVPRDQSTSTFVGEINVAQDAQKTDASQECKHLLLSDQAKINVEPRLRIAADDVKCAHGASIGQISAEQLHYMQSRGLKADQASALLEKGFFEQVYADFKEHADWSTLTILPAVAPRTELE